MVSVTKLPWPSITSNKPSKKIEPTLSMDCVQQAKQTGDNISLGNVFDSLIRNDIKLNIWLLSPQALAQNIQHLLVLSLICMGVYGAVVGFFAETTYAIPIRKADIVYGPVT